MKKAVKISEKSTIELGLFFAGVGFAIFVGAQWNRIEKAEASIISIKQRNSERDGVVSDINTRLSRIEGKLDSVLEQRGRGK